MSSSSLSTVSAVLFFAGLAGLALAQAPTRAVLGLSTAPATSSLQEQDRPQPPVDLKPGQRCVECHEALTQGRNVHSPAGDQKCGLCHVQVGPPRHQFRPPREDRSVCLDCHQLPARNVSHKPFTDGQCTACHDPHHAENRYLLKIEDSRQLCTQCHTQTIDPSKPFVHGPVAVGSCSLCHVPHTSTASHLLSEEGSAGCMSCHEDMAQRLETATSVHAPVQQDCSLCHDSHSSSFRYQLKAEPKAMCLGCHEDIRAAIGASPRVHRAVTEEQSCSFCHDAHSSRLPKLLNRSVDELCMGCHTQAVQRPDGTEVPGMGQHLASSRFLHGPVEEGNCTSCHNPHGSEHFSLLRSAYPQEFYAPFKLDLYSLCFQCHESEAFTTETTKTLTRFRDGDRNLHFLHVSDKNKGRTCRACHSTHASDLPHHITEKVSFGSWEIPINFVKNESGGTCASGCHVPRSYKFR